MPKLFFAGDVGGIQRLQVGYVPELKIPNARRKPKVWKGSVSFYWDLKQNIHLQNNLWGLKV